MPSAAILVGGRARRFGGRDKSALLVDGRTILERQIDQLSKITDDIMIVGARSAAAHPDVRAVADRVPDHGPLGGLDAALRGARDRELVLVAGDMPFITADFLRHLLSQASDVDAVVPTTDRGYHPLCAVYTRDCLPFVRQALDEGRLAMKELLTRIRVRDVKMAGDDRFGPRAQLLANINTPAELEELTALSGHKL